MTDTNTTPGAGATPAVDTSREAVMRLLDGVTPGPWRLRPDDEADEPAQCIKSRGFDIATCWGGYIAGDSDARFIAASRGLVPALLARAEAAEAEVARLREALVEIDAIDPEHLIGGCAQTALCGLILRMGEIARAAMRKGGAA